MANPGSGIAISPAEFFALQQAAINSQYTQYHYLKSTYGSSISTLYVPGPTGQGTFGSISHNHSIYHMGAEFIARQTEISQSIMDFDFAFISKSFDGTYYYMPDLAKTFELELLAFQARGIPPEAYAGQGLIFMLGLTVKGSQGNASDLFGLYDDLWGALNEVYRTGDVIRYKGVTYEPADLYERDGYLFVNEGGVEVVLGITDEFARQALLEVKAIAMMEEYPDMFLGQPDDMNELNFRENFRTVLGDDKYEEMLEIIEREASSFCFPAFARVRMADGSERAISDVLLGDEVLSFARVDGEWISTSGKVTRLFRNTTTEWLKITGADLDAVNTDILTREMDDVDIEATYVTPGHEFLNEYGRYEAIESIVLRGGNLVREDGTLRRVAAERVIFNRATSSLFEEVQSVLVASAGNLALSDSDAFGWTTYNFEVQGHHNYVANGWRVHNDSQFYVDMAGSIGASFGTQLGSLITQGESQFVQLVAGTALGVVAQNLAEVIVDTGFHLFDGSQINFGASLGVAVRQLEDIHLDFAGAAVGTIASFFVAELGEALGLEGFGADLFNVAVGSYAGSVLKTAAANALSGSGQLLSGADFVNAFAAMPGILGAFFGSAIAREILPADSIQGTIGGALGSIAGASLAATAFGSTLGAALGTLGNFIVPGIGAFFGTLIGTFLGNLFGDDPEDPNINLDLFVVDSLPEDRGGVLIAGAQYASIDFSDEVAQRWMNALITLSQDYLESTGGIAVANAYVSDFTPSDHFDSMSPYVNPLGRVLQRAQVVIEDGTTPRYYLNGVEVDGAEQMIDGAIVEFIKETQIVGGDILAKRAIANSSATSTAALTGDIAAAEEYSKYLDNRESVNAFVATSPNSVFAAAWTVAWAQAAQLELSKTSESDFNGGLKGFLASLAHDGLYVDPTDVAISQDAGTSKIHIDVAVASAFVMPGAFAVYADAVERIMVGDQAFLRFTFFNNMANVGYENSTRGDFFGLPNEWMVSSSTGRNVFIAPDSDRYNFFDDNAGPITAGSAEIESSDVIFVGGAGQDSAAGGNGSDWLVGNGGNDGLNGFAGDDILLGGLGDDYMEGGAGHDYLEGGAGADFISGVDYTLDPPSQPGSTLYVVDFDTAGYASSDAAVSINLAADTASGGHATGDQLYYIINLVGSDFADTLIGDEFSNVLEGGAGADILNGGTNSAIYKIDWASYQRAKQGVIASLLDPTKNTGDAAGDTYISMEGLRGSAFGDLLEGDANTLALYGHDGNDVLVLGSGTVEVDGSFGFDIASYRNAAAAVTINLQNWAASSATVRDDVLLRVEGHEGSAFADSFIGSANADFLFGVAGNDTMDGADGNDVLSGGDGDDILRGGLGADVLDGGSGLDAVSYAAAAAGVRLDLSNLSSSTGEAAGDSFVSIENFIGSAHADSFVAGDLPATFHAGAGGDILVGGKEADQLFGEDGNDNLSGGLGDDRLTGGLGADILDGGDGRDEASYAAATAAVRVDLSNVATNSGEAAGDSYVSIEKITGSIHNDTLIAGAIGMSLWSGAGNDAVTGGIGMDYLYGEVGSDTLSGNDGNDWLEGGAGADILNGGNGNDTASYASAAAGVRVELTNAAANTGDAAGDTFNSIETLRGSAFNDVLVGWSGTAWLYGAAGNDTLSGGASTDYLYGEAGVDTLNGNDGSDLLEGGAGADILNGGNGNDTASYAGATAGVRADLGNGAANTGDAAGDMFNSIETLRGSAFNDILAAGAANSWLYGAAGDDTLTGGVATDRLFGEAGNDTLSGGDGDDVLSGGNGADVLNGGNGTDTASYESASTGLRVDLANGASNTGEAAGDTYSDIEKVNGSAFDDVLVAGATGMFFYAGAGNDTLTGGMGPDALYGEAGNDALSGGDGDDTLYGGEGADQLSGGAGFDTASYKHAAAGLRVELSNAAANTGEASGDTYSGIERLGGSEFADTLVGHTTFSSAIYGGGGNDTIMGGSQVDLLLGEAGNDAINGAGGNDTLDGGDGDDVMQGGAGTDILLGGAGFDTASYALATAGVRADLSNAATNTGDAAGDTYTSIEFIRGSAFADTLILNGTVGGSLFGGGGDDILTGGSAANNLYGEVGNDTLDGSDGNDVLQGGAGADILIGGAGLDTASYALATAGIRADLTNAASNTGDAAGDTFSSIESLRGSAFADTLILDASTGGSLFGGAGNDNLVGSSVANIIHGEAGNDNLTGGLGDDLFVFAAASGDDTILDFQAHNGTASGDIIMLQGLAADTFAELMLAATEVSGSSVFNLDNGDSITLSGVALSQLTAADFRFA